MDLENNIFVDQVISYMKKINFEPYERTQLMESIYLCDKFYNCVEDIIEHINKQNLIRQELTVFIHSYELINEHDFAFKNKIKDLVRTLIENNGYNIEKCKDSFVKEKIDYTVNLLRLTLNDPNNSPKHIHTNKNTDFYLNGISILNCIKQKKAYKPYKEGNDSLSSLRTKVSILHECATTDKYIELTKLILYFNVVDINNRNCEITSEDFPYYKIGFTIKNNCSKNTPLHIACLANSIKTMIYLLRHGASPIIKNNSGETPLHYCKNQKKLDFMMNYISQNKDILKKELYTSLLFSACKKGFTELIPYLTTKVDINTVVEKNETPIFFAPNINVLKLLIKLGADINHQDSNGNTLLYKYAYTDEIYITKELIESGAKVDLKNRFGITCLDIGFRRKERKNMAIEYACNNLIKTIHLYSKTENGYFNEFKENVLNDENIFIDYILSYLDYFTI